MRTNRSPASTWDIQVVAGLFRFGGVKMLDPFSQPEEFRRMTHHPVTLEQERQANQAAALRYVQEMRPDWIGMESRDQECLQKIYP
jgi:hypothetical protein